MCTKFSYKSVIVKRDCSKTDDDAGYLKLVKLCCCFR